MFFIKQLKKMGSSLFKGIKNHPALAMTILTTIGVVSYVGALTALTIVWPAFVVVLPAAAAGLVFALVIMSSLIAIAGSGPHEKTVDKDTAPVEDSSKLMSKLGDAPAPKKNETLNKDDLSYDNFFTNNSADVSQVKDEVTTSDHGKKSGKLPQSFYDLSSLPYNRDM